MNPISSNPSFTHSSYANNRLPLAGISKNLFIIYGVSFVKQHVKQHKYSLK